VRIAREVADALDYAHRNDVIHRDIKPANILLHDGRPGVADFGIALAISAAGGGRMTETGLSLGTPHYMSPEQASADRDLSARSDVYSLGCVLYEMLAGQPPHTGPSAQSILVRILTEDPRDVLELRRTVPVHVAATVMKSIEKLPADRFNTAKEFMEALLDVGFRHTSLPRAPKTTTVSTTQPPADAPKALVGALAATLIVMTGLAAWGWLRPTEAADRAPPVRTRLALDSLGIGRESGKSVAISRDGSMFAFFASDGAREGIFLRRADNPELRYLPEALESVSPTFSPDGQWLAFSYHNEEIRKVSLAGGPALPIASGRDPHWGTTESIAFRGEDGIYTVPSSGGQPTRVVSDDLVERGTARTPHLLPDGKGLLFSALTRDSTKTMLLDFESGEITEIGIGGEGIYVPTGHILYGHPGGSVFAVGFDLASKTVTGDPVPVLPAVTVLERQSVQIAVSANGTLLYAQPDAASEGSGRRRLVWVGLDGSQTPLMVKADDARGPRFSPDGRRAAYQWDLQVWIYDLNTRANRQFTFEGENFEPLWSHDGAYVYFTSIREGSQGEDGYRKAVDGASPAERVFAREGEQHLLSRSPDGRWLVLAEEGPERGKDLLLVDLEADPVTIREYLAADFDEIEGAVSPNGRFMAYASEEQGRYQLFVRGFPDPVGQWRVSEAGGHDPVWAPDGSALYFLSGGSLYRASVSTDGAFSSEPPSRLMAWPFDSGGELRIGYDIAPDGDRFLATLEGSPGAGFGDVYVVTNWFDELKRRMGEGH
jgi:serine/threonine-protein kinase